MGNHTMCMGWFLNQPPRERCRLGSFSEDHLDRNTRRCSGSLQRGLRLVLGRFSENEWVSSSVVECDAPNVEAGVRFPGDPQNSMVS